MCPFCEKYKTTHGMNGAQIFGVPSCHMCANEPITMDHILHYSTDREAVLKAKNTLEKLAQKAKKIRTNQ